MNESNLNESNLIERYVNAVAEHLPEDARDDVKRELKANIEDMLPEHPTQEDIRDALEQLGNPMKLANEYRQTNKYLIGPALYDSYISILKLVTGIAAIVFVFIDLIGLVSKPAEVSFQLTADLFAGILSSAFSGIANGFLWVTIIFVVLDRIGVHEGNLPFKKAKWSVDDLPPWPTPSKNKISRVETIVGLFFNVFFTVLFVVRPHVIGWYGMNGNELTLLAPLFNIEQLQSYIFAIVILAIVQFVLSIYKFIVMRWDLPLAIFNTINNIAASILVYFMFTDKLLIDAGFVSLFAETINVPVSSVISGYHTLATAFIVLSIIGYAIDSVMGFVKSRRISLPSIKIT